MGSINPHWICIRHLLDSRQAFPHLQSLLIYSINSGIQVRVPAALVGAVTVCQAECQPLLILVSLGFFSPLIHVSDSRRGTLKSAAHHSWSSCPHSWVWLCLVSLVSTCFSCGYFILGWAPTLHGTFACSAPSVTLWSMGVRREGWGWGRHGLQREQAVPCWFIHSHPMPQQWQWGPCVPPPSLQEGGHAVVGCCPGSTTVRGCSGPAPVEVTRGTGEE